MSLQSDAFGIRRAGAWPLDVIYSGQAGEQVDDAAQYAEGIDAFDVDGDGRLDLLAGNPAISSSWIGRDLLPRDMVHGHTLDLGDIDGDGDRDVLNKPYTWNAPRVDLWLNGRTRGR